MQNIFEKYMRLIEKIINFYYDNQTKIDAYTGIRDIFLEIIANKVKIDLVAEEQSDTSVGISDDKSEERNTLVDLLYVIIAAARVYAKKAKNNTLFEKVNYSYSDIKRLSDTELATKGNHIYKLLLPLLNNLSPYGIVQEDFDNTLIAITAFKAIKNAPIEFIEKRKSKTLRLKNLLINDTNTIIREQLDFAFDAIQFKEPGLYHLYIRINILDERGLIHHVGLLVIAKDEITKEPIKDALLTVPNIYINQETNTKKDGTAYLELLITGDYVGTLSATGYTSKTFDIHINRKKRTVIEILMTAAIL